MLLPVDTLITFIIASALLSLAPGPDNIVVLTQAALSGRRAGLLITLGLCTGLLAHTIAVALGAAAIFQGSAAAFNGLKAIGACYLLYLAWQAARAPSQPMAGDAIKKSRGALYRRGFILNITNPKVIIFFLAFLPLFADPALGSLTMQILLLGVVFMLVALAVFSGIAVLSGFLRARFATNPQAQGVLNKIAAVVFAALALKLLLSG